VSDGGLAARCRELLGSYDGTLAMLGPGSTAPDAAGAAIVSFVGAVADPVARRTLLERLRHALPAGAPVVVADHNQPRRVVARVVGCIVLLLRGLPPVRARYPTARELAALGFVVERLRLADGERVQLVVARVPA
jgi:hypothetical protein